MKSFKRTLTLVAACFAAGALLTGCATQVKQEGATNPRVEAAKNAFGPGFDYMIVESGSRFSDTFFVGLFKSGPSSDLARDLATRLAAAELKPTRFMVSGANSEKTAQVIIQALSFHVKDGLPKLELLYLGEQTVVPGIEEAVKRVGGKMRFAPYPG